MSNTTNNDDRFIVYANNIKHIKIETVNIMSNLQALIDDRFKKGIFNQEELDFLNTLLATYNTANRIFSLTEHGGVNARIS